LQRCLRGEFGGRVRKVVVPPEPGKAVVVGAALYGLNQAPITGRVPRATYGCAIRRDFLPGQDPEAKKVWNEPRRRQECDRVFDVFVKAGEAVGANRKVTKIYAPGSPHLTHLLIDLYATKRTDVKYTDEPHVRGVGRMTLHMP